MGVELEEVLIDFRRVRLPFWDSPEEEWVELVVVPAEDASKVC